MTVKSDDLLVAAALLRGMVDQQHPMLRAVYLQASNACLEGSQALDQQHERVTLLGQTVTSLRKKLGRLTLIMRKLPPLWERHVGLVEGSAQARVEGDFDEVARLDTEADELGEAIKDLMCGNPEPETGPESEPEPEPTTEGDVRVD